MALYLYGPRWPRHLARVLGVTAHAVRRWRAGTRVPRAKVSEQIAVLVQAKHNRELAVYADMLDLLSDTPTKAGLIFADKSVGRT